MYVITRSIEHGYRGTIFSSVGLAAGDLLQVLCTVVGVSALLVSSVVFFTILKYAGAAYLIALGIRQLLSKHVPSLAHLRAAGFPVDRVSSWTLSVQAFFALNPKTAIFFLALFPQFVTPNAGPAWRQILLFGCMFVVLGFITNSLYGCLGGTIASVARNNARFQESIHYVSGVVLLGMGIAAGLASAPARPL